MEFIRKEPTASNLENRDAVKEFLSKVKTMNQIQKLKYIYTYFTDKKPDALLSEDKILNRILYEAEFGPKLKETEQILHKQKRFKFPWKVKNEMKKSSKKREMVLVFYLNMKNELEWPRVYPIYGTNMVIIRSKPYFFDPRAVVTFGKHKCIIYREMDRKPVSNLDYDDVKKRGDSTESDELLIKAALKAVIQGGQKKEMNKTVIIIVVIIIIAAVVFFMAKG